MSLKSKLCVFFVLFLNNVFTQTNEYPVITKIEKDTVIIFTLQQGRELIIYNEQRKEYMELNEILNSTIVQKDTVINSLNQKVSNYEKIDLENKKIIKTKEELIKLSEDEKSTLKHEVRKHKTGKWIAIAGCVTLAILGIVF